MALSYVEYTATGGQTVFDFTIPILDAAHINLSYDGVAQSGFSYNATTQKVTAASGAAADQAVKVWRETPGRLTAPNNVMLTDFQDGSVLTEADLDAACLQLLYIAQEAGDDAFNALKTGADGHFTAKVGVTDKRITNVANATSAQDAVTKAQLESTVGSGTLTPQILTISTSQSASYGGGDTTATITGTNLISDTNERVICAVGGVLQRPTTDFTVTNAGSNFTLVLKGEDLTDSGTLKFPVTLQIPY